MASATAFPANIIDTLVGFYETTDGVTTVLKRPALPSDPDGTFFAFSDNWVPLDYEIGAAGPTIARYACHFGFLTKTFDKEGGREAHSIISKNIRVMLYHDQTLRLRLQQLKESMLGITERVQRYGVTQQRFYANDLPQAQFLYVSAIDLWVETETV